MKFQINLGKLICVWILVVIPTLVNPSPVSACSPPNPTPWFVEVLRIKSPELLPDEVNITEQENGEFLSINNQTELILYVLVEETDNIRKNVPPPKFPINVPEGYVPFFYLASGKVHEWGVVEYKETGEEIWDWELVRYNDAKFLKIFAYGDRLAATWIIMAIEPLNRVEDNRPENVGIPEPQNVFIPIIYGEEYIEIPIAISYEINPDYLPNSVEIASKACLGAHYMYLLEENILIIVAILIIIIGVLFAQFNNE